MILLFNIQQNLTAIGAGFLRFLFWWQKPAIVINLHATLTLMIDKIINHQILSEKKFPTHENTYSKQFMYMATIM